MHGPFSKILGAQYQYQRCMYACTCMYFILQHENSTQNIKPEGQQGLKVLTSARNKNVSIKILASTYNVTYKYNMAE